MRGRFADCFIDTAARDIRRDETRVELAPKAFLLLETLIAAAPDAVSKESLYERLWPGVFVEMGNLHTLVSEIRTAIGDDEHRIIRTVHRFGYKFDAEFRSDDAPAAMLYIGSQTLPLDAGDNVIGRDLIGSIDVSRNHACITITPEAISISDLGSKNGTWVRGKRVESAKLEDGDEIFLGSTRAVIRRTSSDATMTAPPPVSESRG